MKKRVTSDGAAGRRVATADPPPALARVHAPETEPTPVPRPAPDQVEGGRAAHATAVVRGEAAAASEPQAHAAPEANLGSLTDARALVDELIARSFPELRGEHIEVEAKEMGADAFRSTVRPASVLLGPRRYVIQVNPDLFDRQLTRSAAEAILAHELCHTVDYGQRSALGMLGLGLSYARPSATIAYERRTDLEAIARGYGEGLRAFRRWQEAHLPPQALAEKRRVYFTAAEIEAVEQALSRRPDLLERWRSRPPRSIDEVARALQE